MRVFTRILIVVQVLASSYSESESRDAATGGPGGSQLLAQHQALRGHVSVTVEDQYSASPLVASEWTAHRHVYGMTHMYVLDISRVKAPLRQELRKTYR